MTFMRQVSEIASKQQEVLQLGGRSFGPAQLNSKLHIAVASTSLGDASCQAHSAPPHLMRQSKTLALGPVLRDSIQIKHQLMRTLPNIQLTKILQHASALTRYS